MDQKAGQSGWYPGQVQTGPPGPNQVPANPTVIQFAPPPEYGQPVLSQGLPPPKSAYNIQSPYNYTAPSNQMPPQRAVLIDRQISNVTMVGGCPYCQVGMAVNDFTCLGVLLAIVFFPLGLLCCWLLRETRCRNCGADLR